MTPIYVDSKQSWELTWPIWHMLPRSERKIIARQYGYNTIGDFEEFMSLNRALSQDSSEVAMPTPALSHTHNSSATTSTMEHAVLTPLNIPPPQNMESLSDDEGDNTSGGDKHNELESKEDLIDDLESSSLTISRQQALVNGGRILMLPDDVLMYRILAYLDIDYFAVCALVSPHWKSFTRTEAVYREICHRCYLQQSKRKELHVVRFGNSYRNMLYMRPRVAYCGLYVLKFSQIKKIQRDMWTEIPPGAVLETTYYRYAYFQENGQVLYALSPLAPHEMIPKFVKIRKEGSAFVDSKSGILWGTYQVQKYQVTIHVSHAWHDVKLVLKILENGCEESPGRFRALSFEKHFSSASGDFDEYLSRDLVEYNVPHQPFVFIRDWRL